MTVPELLQHIATLARETREPLALASHLDELAWRLEKEQLTLDCVSCREQIVAVLADGVLGHAPRHQASRYCESGKHPHCTCDTCF